MPGSSMGSTQMHGKSHHYPGLRHHGSRKHKHPKARSPLHNGPATPRLNHPIALAPSATNTNSDQPAGSDHPVWSDEFDGPAGARPDPAKWSFDIGGNGWGNGELQYYTAQPSNASLDGEGDLVIAARTEQYVGSDDVTRAYTSARLETLESFQFTYGFMEARVQVPEGKGLLPAFWSLGNDAYTDENRWPGCGEIDAMEILGSKPNVLYGTLHGPWPSAPHGIGGKVESAAPLSADFHTYGVRWAPNQISFLLDGLTYETISREDLPVGHAWPFQHPNFLLLDLAVGGDWPGSPNAFTKFPARMVVDWVRVWQ